MQNGAGRHLDLDAPPPAATTGERSYYNMTQAATLIGGAKHIAQYMDRDTRPDFASTVMIPSLQQFLNKPGDYNKLVGSIEKQKKAIFGT